MNKFGIPVLLGGYSFIVGNNLREQKTGHGMPRQIIVFVGSVHSVNATIALPDERSQQYFWAFWRQNQGRDWLWDLPLDKGPLEECECRFTAESLPSESNRGSDFLKMSFQVLVKPIKRSAAFDAEIIRLWNQKYIPKEFAKVPNVYFPDATGVK